jgi:putative hydrolase of the HAD superfamily
MTIRAVFFDVVGTLARFVPEQEEVLVEAASSQGVALTVDQARRSFAAAGEWWNRVVGLRYRAAPAAEREALNLEYDRRLFDAAGVEADAAALSRIFRELFRRGRPTRLEAYPDAAPALSALKRRGLTLGVISNMGRDLPSVLEEIGLAAYLQVVVASGEVGVSKPDRRIFELTLQRAGVPATEAIYVGDLYDSDVLGARGAGITPAFLDRYGLFPQYQDCLRIAGLDELLSAALL